MNIQAPDAHVFRFGIFELDAESGELRALEVVRPAADVEPLGC